MKRVVSLGIVVLLCGVGLQGGVTLPVQQESLSPILYEPKSPLARNHKLLQLVTEADRVLQLSSAAWGSMLIHDEWSELTGWLAMAPGRKPKDFKQRCVALRNFIQQSPEVDPVVSAAVLKALACIMSTYTGMSVGAKVGIGVGVAVTALTALATFAKLRGRILNPRGAALGGASPAGGGGAVPQSDAVGAGHMPGNPSDTSHDEVLARGLEELERFSSHVGGLHGGGGHGAAAGSSNYPSLPSTAVRETHDDRDLHEALEASRRLMHQPRGENHAEMEAARKASVAAVNEDARSKLAACINAWNLLTEVYVSGNSAVIAELTSQAQLAESAYNSISREGAGYLSAYKRQAIAQLEEVHDEYTRAKQSYEERLRLAPVSMPRGDLSPIEASLPPAQPSPKRPVYETPTLPEEMREKCDEAYALYVSVKESHPVKARAWALYQAYLAYSNVYVESNQLTEPQSNAALVLLARYRRARESCNQRLTAAQSLIGLATRELEQAQSGSGAASGAGAGTGPSA